MDSRAAIAYNPNRAPGEAMLTLLLVSAVAHAACGDATIDLGEACDDGNLTAGDGCDAACAVEPGFRCERPEQPFVARMTTNARTDCGNPFTGRQLDAPAWGAYLVRHDGTTCASPWSTGDNWYPWVTVRATGASGLTSVTLTDSNGGSYYRSATCGALTRGLGRIVDASGGGGMRFGHTDTPCTDNRGGSSVDVIAVSWCVDTAGDLDGDGVPDASDACPLIPDHVSSYFEANEACVATASQHAGAVVGARAHVYPGAVVDGALLGADAVVERGASVGPGGVVGRKAVVGARVPLGLGVVIGPHARIGGYAVATDGPAIDGLVVGYGAVLGEGARLGDAVTVGNRATLGHGVALGTGAHLGRVTAVGEGSALGTAARIGPEGRLGDRSTLGADTRANRGLLAGDDVSVGDLARLGRDVTLGDGAVVGPRAAIRASATVEAGASVPANGEVPRGGTVSR